jgi:hypothetical protein
LEQWDSTDAPVGVDRFHGGGHRQYRGARTEKPAVWIGLLALLPLAVLLFTGLYLFALPYASKWRRGRRAE